MNETLKLIFLAGLVIIACGSIIFASQTIYTHDSGINACNSYYQEWIKLNCQFGVINTNTFNLSNMPIIQTP